MRMPWLLTSLSATCSGCAGQGIIDPIDDRQRFRFRRTPQRELLTRRRDLAALSVMGATPPDLLDDIGKVGGHRHVVNPRHEFVIVPLLVTLRRRHLEHATTEEQ